MYRVVCQLGCDSCGYTRVLKDDIDVDDEQTAINIFMARHLLCPACAAFGKNSNISFKSQVHTSILPAESPD